MIGIKEYKKKEYVFDNTVDKISTATIFLDDEIVFLDYNWLIDTQFSGGNTGELFNSLKLKMNLGTYSKAPCGGFVNLFQIKGNKEGDYLLYSGINEVSNSHYVITIHEVLSMT